MVVEPPFVPRLVDELDMLDELLVAQIRRRAFKRRETDVLVSKANDVLLLEGGESFRVDGLAGEEDRSVCALELLVGF